MSISHFLDLQNWSLTIRSSLVSYQRHIFGGLGEILPLCRGYSPHILSLADRVSVFLCTSMWECKCRWCARPGVCVHECSLSSLRVHVRIHLLIYVCLCLCVRVYLLVCFCVCSRVCMCLRMRISCQRIFFEQRRISQDFSLFAQSKHVNMLASLTFTSTVTLYAHLTWTVRLLVHVFSRRCNLLARVFNLYKKTMAISYFKFFKSFSLFLFYSFFSWYWKSFV